MAQVLVLGDQAIQPVRLVRGDAPESARAADAGVGAWVWGGVVVAVVAGAVIAWRWWERRRSGDQAEAAFRSLARKRRLSRGQRELVVSMAGGAHPVALVLSREAFARCADAGVRTKAAWANTAALTELHARLFGV